MRGMSKGESRETISSARQRNYWNHLADAYAQMTRIRIDDFHFGPQIPGENTLHLLPTFQPGQRALELGCGGAQNSIWLAKQGVACVALDISQGQLAHAKQLAAKAGVSIDLRRSSLERFETVLEPGELFDFVHSSHALEFVQEPGAIVAAMRLGGFLCSNVATMQEVVLIGEKSLKAREAQSAKNPANEMLKKLRDLEEGKLQDSRNTLEFYLSYYADHLADSLSNYTPALLERQLGNARLSLGSRQSDLALYIEEFLKHVKYREGHKSTDLKELYKYYTEHCYALHQGHGK